jgi:hypothetical protein
MLRGTVNPLAPPLIVDDDVVLGLELLPPLEMFVEGGTAEADADVDAGVAVGTGAGAVAVVLVAVLVASEADWD